MTDKQVGTEHKDSGADPGWYKNPQGDLQWWDGASWGPVAPSDSRPVLEDGTPLPRFVEQKSAGDLSRQSSVSSRQPRGKKGNAFGAWSLAFALIAIVLIVVPSLDTTAGLLFAAAGLVLGIAGVSLARARRITGAVWGLVLSAVFSIGGLMSLAPAPANYSSSVESPTSNDEVEVAEPASPEPTVEEQRDAQMEEQGFSVWSSGETWLRAAEPGSFTCDSGTRCLWYTLASYSGCPAGFYVKADVLNANELAIGWTNEITASVAPNDGVAFQLRTLLDASTIRVAEVNCMG